MPKVLNVGGGNKQIPIPKHYDGWEHLLLDIDPKSEADLILDARKLIDFSGFITREYVGYRQFDSIYCSHNLEHYARHDMPKVLQGFSHVLTEEGFAQIIVPNMQWVCEQIASGEDIEDVAYVSPAGPIRYVDMIYGHSGMIERSGNDFMCHKNGFTAQSLSNALFGAGFEHVFIGVDKINLIAYAFKQAPSAEVMQTLKLSTRTEPSGTSDNEAQPPASTPDLAPAGPITAKGDQ